MFRLEKLEIHGFKSFADRTSLVFGEGITAVVCPNGCGKSNISDAISWVLGEQSAKSLRGGKMEDVIFNGTRDRKPTGMAEVLLTLVAIEDIAARDDSSGEHEYEDAMSRAEQAAEAARSLVHEATREETDKNEPADLSASVIENTPAANLEAPAVASEGAGVNDEASEKQEAKDKSKAVRSYQRSKRKTVAVTAGERITIGRRLYRTGDSEYLMNGRPCLLRDVQDLFAGTGLGGAHYAIIEQGRIGQILSSKPLDRRALIEEAAGITKFKSRKRAAELKLESAKSNLTRLNDIISEVERQVNSLKRQAQKARRYRRLREEMRSLLKVVFTADYYRLNEAIERVARELEEAERSQTDFGARIIERETEYRAASAEARAGEDRLTELREKAASLELEADRARNRRAFDEQQSKELTARIDELKADQESLESRLALLDEESERRRGDIDALEAAIMAEQAGQLGRENDYQTELGNLHEAEGEIEQLRQRMVGEIGVTERLKNLSASLEDALRKVGLKQTNLGAEFERAVARRDEAEADHARAGEEVEQDLARLEELTARIAERAANLLELTARARALRGELEDVQRERTSAEHRLKSLEDLDAHHAYYSEAVQQVLSPEQAARINALGTLADFVEVEAQYERLIESLFGRELQCVLVPTIDDALSGVDYIKSEGLGRGAFLVVGLHGGEGDAPFEGDAPRGGDTPDGGDENSAGDNPRARSVERWLIESETGYSGPRFAGEYIPIERQLPPADFSMIEPLAEWPYDREIAEAKSFADSDFESDHLDNREIDDRARYDEHEGREAARFQLDVLRAIDLLFCRPEIKSVVERAFPDKCAASVVPDIEAALHLSIENPARIYVTYAGEQVVNGRLIVTGAPSGRQGTSLLGLKREIKQLRVQTVMLGQEDERVAAALTEVEAEREGLQGEASALDQDLRRHEKEATRRNSELEALARDLERARQHVRVVEAEQNQADEERSELESRLAELAAELAEASQSREATHSALAQSQSRFAEIRSRVEQVSEELSSARASVAARAERLQAARSEARRADNESEELRSRINRNRLELYESHNRVEKLMASQADGINAVERLDAERTALAGQVGAESESLQRARSRVDELERMLAEIRQAEADARDRRGHVEVEQARIESEAEHLARACHTELAMSLEDVVTSVELAQGPGARSQRSGQESREVSEEEQTSDQEADQESLTPDSRPLTTDEARARLDELRLKLDDMGPVNMMALEELEEAELRLKFLSEQRRDILDSIRMTEEALSEIKRRSRERFRHAFANINQNFQHMFVELFGGGRGEMVLIDEEDILESGIDIIAQPPGKRLQNVLLLSGGEKAMAAISLVLAIFQYRPSPFCILDEVDAPLDEINVGRFSGKVIEMSSDTQFLVITHNKRTMEAARALYGVTMEEPGVSKLVSVKFE
jgi:chromosome segregation protein